jgi:hypothetical protein
LLGQEGFDRHAAAITVGHGVGMGSIFRRGPAPPSPPRSSCASSGPARDICPAPCRSAGRTVEDADGFEVAAAADLEVSLKSCAGVILTAPEPFSGSWVSSATIGILRPTSGSTACLPIRCLPWDRR